MNFAVDLMMMKSMNKNDTKSLSTIYDIDGDNLFCLGGDGAIKYYETVNFLKEHNKDPTLENVRRVFDMFLKEYDPFFRLLSPKKYTQSYIEHIEKLKKKRMIQVLMESFGFVYMAYQIFSSLKKINTTSKYKYIPLIGIVLYVAINVFNAYYANYTKKEYNIVKTLRPRLNDTSGNVYVQISEIQKINSKASSLYYEMLKNKSEQILKYVDNPILHKQEKVSNKTNNVFEDDSEIGIEMSKLEEIERQFVPSAFINKPDLFVEDVIVPELFPQETILIEIESKSCDKSIDKEEEKEINLENIQNVNIEDDKLSVTEELLEEIEQEIEQEIKQEQQQEKINSVEKEQIDENKEIELEEPKKRGRRNNTTQSKPKQTKPKQTKQTKQTKPKSKQNKK
jgi:hypothetical protein